MAKVENKNTPIAEPPQSFMVKIWKTIIKLTKNVRLMAVITILTLIAALIPAYYSIIDHQKPKQIDKIKSSINDKINIIESSFHPEVVKVIDSLEYTKYIKEFKTSALDLCYYWKEKEKLPTFESFSSHDMDYIVKALDVSFKSEEKAKQKIEHTIDIANKIDSISNTQNIKYYESPNFLRMHDLEASLTMSSSKSDYYKMNGEEHMRRASILSARGGDEYKEEVKKSLLYFDSARNEIRCYQLDSTIFEFIIESNDLYDIILRNLDN